MLSLEFVLNAITLGSLCALLALGLVIVYGILKLVNFAYGELIMVAGYTLYLLNEFLPLPWLGMAVVAIFVAMLTSFLTEIVAFRPVRTKSLTAMLITSFAVSTLLQNAALLIISPRARAVPLPKIFSASVTIWDISVPWRNILTIVISLALLIGLNLLLRKTILGIALRAAANNFRMTRLLGVPANLVISTAFLISGLLAGIVALFWVGRTASVTPTIGGSPLLIAFVATVIGGMNNLVGAVVGGYIYGIIFSFLGILLPQSLLDYREAFMFLVVILILLFRPEGLIRGAGTGERVG
ncbi:MAG: High-affinity branched-chain amino acid transport system permease protein LivH [Anaerolineae bacterium]|nr:MAG: High-affinity branched-chain amino acid transport system permease protein LivH [Anaerolineae bacterium]